MFTSKQILLAISCASLLSLPLSAATIEGVAVAPQVTVSGKKLTLNGAGLRTVTLIVIPVKAYVAAFYTPSAQNSPQAVMASPGPLQFQFTFLQGVSSNQVAQAWKAQFDTSVTETYAGFEKDRDAFIGFFGALKKQGVQKVEIEGDQTRAFEGDTLKGTITGKDFQKAFLSLWFGAKPVQASLKKELLGN